MSEYTNSLNLKLPSGSKYWNYDTWNDNMTKLDGAYKDIERRQGIDGISASDLVYYDSNVQTALDNIAMSFGTPFYEIELKSNTILHIPNYSLAHIIVYTKHKSDYPNGEVPTIEFKKSISDDRRFTFDTGTLYDTGQTILSINKSTAGNWNVRLGNEWYYKFTNYASGTLFIDKATDPFFENIISSNQYNYDSTFTENYENVFTINFTSNGFTVLANVSGLNYGWSPFDRSNLVRLSTSHIPSKRLDEWKRYEFDFIHLNCIWSSRSR